MAIRIEDARLEELLCAWAPTLDLRLALEEGALRWVGPEEQREQAMARVVEDFDELHGELDRRLALCHMASRLVAGHDGCSLEDDPR